MQDLNTDNSDRNLITTFGINHLTIKERNNNMSFNICYVQEDIAFLGSDSRETYGNKQYNDKKQKTFINRDLKIIWSMTGIMKWNYIDYTYIVNTILNNAKTNIYQKLLAIKCIMNAITRQIYLESQNDVIFDLFVITLENGKLYQYTLESKNGETLPGGYNKYDACHLQSSGVHTEMEKKLKLDDISMSNSIVMVERINNLISDVIEVDKECFFNTVGGDIYIATMDNKGNIRTYVNGVESDFKIM